MNMEIPGLLQNGNNPETQKQQIIKDSTPAKSAVQPQRATVPAAFSSQELEKMLDNFTKTISHFNRRFKFYINEDINRVIVKVIDRDTDKVIREIPPEEIQHLISSINEMVGLLVDQKI